MKNQLLGLQADFFFKHKNLCLTVLTALIIIITPFLLENEYLVHIACMVGINILMALGMHMVTGLAGQINMGQYGYFCIGAYSGAILSTTFQLPFEIAILITIAISAFFGLLVGIPSLKVEGPYLALCTIGFAESVRLIINGAAWANRAEGISRIPRLSIFGFVMETRLQSYYFIMVFVILGIICVNNIMDSNFGRRFKAIKDDPLAASVFGINIVRIKLLAFAICAIFGGIGGHLYANYASFVNPATFIQAMQVNFLLMIVLGGLGSSWGAVIGAVLVTIVFEYTRIYVEFQRVAFGVIMVLIVLFLRRGLIGTIVHYFEQRKIREHHYNTQGEKK